MYLCIVSEKFVILFCLRIVPLKLPFHFFSLRGFVQTLIILSAMFTDNILLPYSTVVLFFPSEARLFLIRRSHMSTKQTRFEQA